MNRSSWHLFKRALWISGALFLLNQDLFAANPQSIPLISSSTLNGDVTYSLNIKILIMMALLSVLPALLMTMSAFTRIIIVLSILRQALGIPNVPSNQVLIGLGLILTVYVMMPTINKINDAAITPFNNGQVNESQAIERSLTYLKEFMLKQTRKADLNVFRNLSKTPKNETNTSLYILMPAFVTSELKTAFQIGFLIFLPFLIIDLVTASVLMSMGMMMLSPMIISLPFKIIFFVMVNGWTLIMSSLVNSFR